MIVFYPCWLIFSASFLLTNVKGQEERVVKGSNAISKQFPYQVLLKRTFANSKNSYCSGIILNEQWILTVAHCLDGHQKNGRSFKVDVIAGDINFEPAENENSSRQSVRAKTWHQHKDYTGKPPYKDDIALIKLSRNLTFNDYVQASNITEERSQESEAGSSCTVSGWGKTEWTTRAAVLQWATITRLANEQCEKLYFEKGENMHGGQMCAGDSGPGEGGSCFGDSGGPLSCRNRADATHVEGLVSWGAAESEFGCGVKPVVFTRVSHYRSWTRGVMGSGCDNELTTLQATGVFVAAVVAMLAAIAARCWLKVRRRPVESEKELEEGLLEEVEAEEDLKSGSAKVENDVEGDTPADKEQKTE